MPVSLLAAGGNILGGIIGAAGSLSAAGTAADASKHAADIQLQEFQQIQSSLYPYVAAGNESLQALGRGLGTGGGNFDLNYPLLRNPLTDLGQAPQYNMPAFDASKFHQSPGYGWAVSQGQNAIQNSAAGKTGAVSGNMLKALDQYTVGAADQDYWNAYNAYAQDYGKQYGSLSNNYWNTANFDQTQQANQFNRLYNTAQSGAQAASSTGQFGTAAAQGIGQSLVGAGNAQAGGILGATNAVNAGLTNLGTQALFGGLGQNSLANNYQYAMNVNNAPYTAGY